jgi:RNA polymerase primary sigma factor
MTFTGENHCNDEDRALASVHDNPPPRELPWSPKRELSTLTEGSDREARNRLVQANLGLVVTIARQFLGRGLELDDLTGEGNLGLIRAAEEFNPRFGTRFSTYASIWIKEAIRRALINTTTTIRLPAHMVGLLTKWRRAELRLVRESGRAATFEEIASVLGLSDVQKALVAQALQAAQLKTAGSCSDESGHRLADEVGDRQDKSEDVVESEDEWVITARRMEGLDARERAILALRYGLDGDVLTFKEIGRRFGMTGEWARRIELRALRKLGDDRSNRAFD